MAAQYWTFVERFPHLFQSDEALLDEISSIIVYFMVGMFRPLASLLSPVHLKRRISDSIGHPTDTLSPWSRGDLEQLLGILRQMKCTLRKFDTIPILSLLTAIFTSISAQPWINFVIGMHILAQSHINPDYCLVLQGISCVA